MASQAEPFTQAGKDLYETQHHWYDCLQEPGCGCGDDDDLMAQIVRVENQARIMTLESLASRFEENIDNYTVINHVINSIRKQARALRERGLF